MNTALPQSNRPEITSSASTVADPPDRASGNPFRAACGKVKDRVSRIRPWDLFFLGMLVVLAFKVDWGAHLMRDLSTPDEAFYLYGGYSLDYPDAQMSPLYCAWYSLLSLVAPDPIDLFYLSWFILPVTLAWGAYLLARSLGGAPLLAFLGGAILLFSRIPDVGPRPMHFAASVVLIGLAIAFSFRSASTRMAIATLSLGLASFARPELTVAFLGLATILLAISCWEAWQRPEAITRLIAMGLIAIVPFCLLSQLFGLPLGGTRSGVAFSQHYSLSKFNAGLIDVEGRTDWLGPYRNYQEVAQEDFGKPIVGLSEAWEIAPAKVLGHFYRNAEALLPTIGGVVTSFSPAIGWGMQGCLALLALLAAVFSVIRLRRTSIRDVVRHAGLPVLVGLVVIAPIIASCLVIYPRDHYLVGLLSISLALLPAIIGTIALPGGRIAPRIAIASIAVLVVLVAPNHFVRWEFDKLFAENPAPAERRFWLENINFVRQIPLQGPLRVMDPASLFNFTDYNFDPVTPAVVMRNGFNKTLKEKDLNVLLIPSRIIKYDILRHDPGYLEFRNNLPPDWVILGQPKMVWWVAVRKDALERQPAQQLTFAPGYERRL